MMKRSVRARMFSAVLILAMAAMWLPAGTASAAGEDTITSVSLTGFAAPVAGEIPVAIDALSTEDARYSVTSISWVPSDTVFGCDTLYYALVDLTAQAGYVFGVPFGDSSAVTVNTGSAIARSSAQGGAKLRISVGFPATECLHGIIDLSEPTPQGGVGWTYASNLFTVTGDVIVTGSTTTRRVLVQPGSNVHIILDGANIDRSGGTGSSNGYAILMDGATVSLTLAEGTKNTLKGGSYNAGLQVPYGATLTIGGKGSLTVVGGLGAGIGGEAGAGSSGGITINSGVVHATGGSQGAGIGCGGGSGITLGCTVNINGGEVTAIGGIGGGAGIGGGYNVRGTNIVVNITGGAVNATGSGVNTSGGGGAGIGGGAGYSTANGQNGSVMITGGTVTAIGNNGAGIGGGRYGTGGSVTITGGTVTAIGNNGAGIGAGNNGSGTSGSITVGGGNVTAVSGSRAINIGSVAVTVYPYRWWASAEATDPGGPGAVCPPTAYSWDTGHRFVKIGAYAGAYVTGVVKSYNPNNPATIELMQGGIEKYTATIAATPGFGQVTQSFTFSDVEPGTYSLVVTKPGHTSFTVQTVVVGNTDLDLTRDNRDAVKCMTLLCGDINGDQMINDNDLIVLWQAANYNKNVGQAANPLCDLNGDGAINDNDLIILWQAVNYNKGPVVITETDNTGSITFMLTDWGFIGKEGDDIYHCFLDPREDNFSYYKAQRTPANQGSVPVTPYNIDAPAGSVVDITGVSGSNRSVITDYNINTPGAAQGTALGDHLKVYRGYINQTSSETVFLASAVADGKYGESIPLTINSDTKYYIYDGETVEACARNELIKTSELLCKYNHYNAVVVTNNYGVARQIYINAYGIWDNL